MRAHGRERIASVATALQVVSTLFHFFYFYADRAPAVILHVELAISKFTEARSAPSEAVFAATFLQVVSRLFQHTASISSRLAVR